MSFACSFPHKLFSFSSVCCVLKKLPVNLAPDNPAGEVLPANMYSKSKLGCIISVMFKSCPSNKQASGGGRLCRIIKKNFSSSLVKNTGVCRFSEWVGLAPGRVVRPNKKCSISFLFSRKHPKENISNLSQSNPLGLNCANSARRLSISPLNI